MLEGRIEATVVPRKPLDVLAQQLVAMCAMDEWKVDEMAALVRRAYPFSELGPRAFESVLDMLSGRYPSDEFAELRPRVVGDRVNGTVRGRAGAQRLAVTNPGTIPDRGLYTVNIFEDGRRVGELDEEMVFESRPGETFVLGASSWKIVDITPSQVLVVPAPGQPGKIAFWHGDLLSPPPGLGRAPGPEALLPAPEEVEQLVGAQLPASALFASRFRENAARALLLPRRRPGQRTPLWQQRQRSADLLKVAGGYADFPILAETYRECMADVFDLDALRELLSGVRTRQVRVVCVDTERASPFAADRKSVV